MWNTIGCATEGHQTYKQRQTERQTDRQTDKEMGITAA